MTELTLTPADRWR